MSNDPHSSFLQLILDVDPIIWKTKHLYTNDKQILLQDLIKIIIIYCNSYSLLHRENKLLILGNHPNQVNQIFPIKKSIDFHGFIPILHELSTIISDGILRSANYVNVDNPHIVDNSHHYNNHHHHITKSSLANALSVALCVTNKSIKKNPSLQSRILVIQARPDAAHSYNAIMNTVFSAQKMNVPIDAVVLSTESSNFLQQASFLTKGIYQHPSNQNDLLQILMTHFLSSSTTRRLLVLPLQKSVEFKAACSCHRQSVEFAFMCSVCLTLVCEKHESCPTCTTPARTNTKIS